MFPNDHSEIAWSHFLAQHFGKVNNESFVKAFYGPLNALDEAMESLYKNRWLDTAEGEQLDRIGSIVGIPRVVQGGLYLPFFGFRTQPSGRGFGVARMRHMREPWAQAFTLGDIEYRIVLNSKIALNNGNGTAEEIIAAVSRTLNVTGVRIFDAGNANARLYIPDFIMPSDPRFYLLDYMLPRAGGVKIWPYFVDRDKTFGFSNQQVYYGFGVGVMARTPGSNIPPIDEMLSIWDRGNSTWDAGNSIWDERGVNNNE